MASDIDTRTERVRAIAARLQPRGLRVRLMQLGFALLLLPALVVGIAAGYERWWIGVRRQTLIHAARDAVDADAATRVRLAEHAHAVIAQVDRNGRTVQRWPIADAALEKSALGSVGERLVGAHDAVATIDRADVLLPAWHDRAEVQAALGGQRAFGRYLTPGGEALLVTMAEPLPDGGALYLLTGSHRGLRRLAVARRQLVQLFIYEAALTIPLVLLFSVGLVRPLERLAAAARAYPAAAVAPPDLMRRRDEIGALARTLEQMAADLDRRRQTAAELGADIAHEFKNPLGTIAAAAELLDSARPPTPERLTLIAGSIGQSVERLRRSIDDLLRLLRLEQAVASEPRGPLPLAALLGTIADEYRHDPRTDGWTFTVDVAGDASDAAPTLNRARFAELLRNLIDNALVQPARQRVVTVGARRDDGGWVVFVRDQGPGISPENQARIFDRFFTHRPDGVPPGTGLGLSIVDSVARAHGGRISVQSAAGEGAEFRVHLPG